MTAARPADLPRLFQNAFAALDADALAALYEPEGRIVADPAAPVVGRGAIREMAAGFMAQRPRFVLEATDVVEAGGLALVRSRWTIAMPDGAGGTSRTKVEPVLVARQQLEGHWLVVVDCPKPLG